MATSSQATKAPAPGFWNSPKTQKRLLIGSAVVLVLGVIAFISVDVLRGTSNAFNQPISNKPAKLTKKEKTVPPDPKAFATAREFMRTAVLRKDLSHAYDLVDSQLKGTMTRKQWETGNIPVIGYPANNINTTAFQVDFSYPTSMLLEVDLVAKKGSGVRPHLPFFLGLKRAGDSPKGRWLVNYWQANWRPPVPASP
jgi:hypothetical protein